MSHPRPARPWCPRRRTVRRLAFTVGGLLATAIAVHACMMMRPQPHDLDLSTTRAAAHGRYRATFVPQAPPIRVGRLHTWTLHVETADGRPLEQAAIAVSGGMPQHGHGLPTRPRVTRALGGGDYQVEGMKFNMDGWWVVTFAIDGAAGADTVTFNLDL